MISSNDAKIHILIFPCFYFYLYLVLQQSLISTTWKQTTKTRTTKKAGYLDDLLVDRFLSCFPCQVIEFSFSFLLRKTCQFQWQSSSENERVDTSTPHKTHSNYRLFCWFKWLVRVSRRKKNRKTCQSQLQSDPRDTRMEPKLASSSPNKK